MRRFRQYPAARQATLMPNVVTDAGSGTAEKAIMLGPESPVMKLAFIAAPVLALYSPMLPPSWLATKRTL